MTGDLSVNIGNGKKLEAPASNEVVEAIGITVATVNEKFQIEEVNRLPYKMVLYLINFFFLKKNIKTHSSKLSMMLVS
jgi:hypothetical protein